MIESKALTLSETRDYGVKVRGSRTPAARAARSMRGLDNPPPRWTTLWTTGFRSRATLMILGLAL